MMSLGRSDYKRWQVAPEQAGIRLDRFLASVASERSRTAWQRLIAEGRVLIDGRIIRAADAEVAVGMIIEANIPQPLAALQTDAEEGPLAILYEDDELLVLDKPAGLVVHPGAGNLRGTLMNRLLAYHPPSAMLPRAGIVHRLDKETSGLMVVAKTQRTYDALVAQLKRRNIKRIYLAVALGRIEKPFVINRAIGRDPRNRTRMAVLARGKEAITEVFPLEPFGARATLIRCTLHTGRTHQIRVHLAHSGHPLIGDPLYGNSISRSFDLKRQALHAAELAFEHPTAKHTLHFTSSLPFDLEALVAALRSLEQP